MATPDDGPSLTRHPGVGFDLLWLPLVLLPLILFPPWTELTTFDLDEGYNLVRAKLFLEGYSLYDEVWYDQPPLMTIWLAALFRITGPSVFAARLLVMGFSLLAAGSLYHLVRNMHGRGVALATIALAGMQLTLGVNSPVYDSLVLPAAPSLDSNLRFFGGMGLGLALMLLWILPRIESRTSLYRLIWYCAFLGGIGRVISIAAAGWPQPFVVGITALEVLGAPVFIYWQHQIARAATEAAP